MWVDHRNRGTDGHWLAAECEIELSKEDIDSDKDGAALTASGLAKFGLSRREDGECERVAS